MVTEPFLSFLNVPGLARNQVLVGAELSGFCAVPHLHWVRGLEPRVREEFAFFNRLGGSIRF